MANVLDRQITEEGPRNAVVKFTGYLDTSDVLESPALSLTDMTNNDPNLYLIGFRFDHIEWSISTGLELILFWEGLNPQQIYPLSGRGKIESKNYGGFTPDMTRRNYSGSILLQTNNYSNPLGTTQNFTVICELVKLYSRVSGSLTP